MAEAEVFLSQLAAEQLSNLAPSVGRLMGRLLRHLSDFPESSPLVFQEGYESYRQVIVNQFRAIYRYFPEENEVRVYCILHTRRALPPSEFLTYQQF